MQGSNSESLGRDLPPIADPVVNPAVDPGAGSSAPANLDPGSGPSPIMNPVVDPVADPTTPAEIQAAINAIFAGAKGAPLSSFQLMYVMYLMQQYGGAQTQIQAENVQHMQGYINELDNVWAIFRSADSPSQSGNTGMDQQFLSALNGITAQMAADPYFGPNGQGSTISGGIIKSIQSLQDLVTEPPTIPGAPNCSALFAWWLYYDPQMDPALAGQAGITGQGDPSQMQNAMSNLGQLNSQFTGVSQVVNANAQVVAKTWSTEQDNLNNFLTQLKKLNEAMIQAQRTY